MTKSDKLRQTHYIMVLLGTFSIYSLDNLIYIFITQVKCCNNQFSKSLHDFLYENEYCGKTKNLTPEIFLYVLEKIFIVNLKKHLKLLSTQGIGPDKLLSTQGINLK